MQKTENIWMHKSKFVCIFDKTIQKIFCPYYGCHTDIFNVYLVKGSSTEWIKNYLKWHQREVLNAFLFFAHWLSRPIKLECCFDEWGQCVPGKSCFLCTEHYSSMVLVCTALIRPAGMALCWANNFTNSINWNFYTLINGKHEWWRKKGCSVPCAQLHDLYPFVSCGTYVRLDLSAAADVLNPI